MTYFLSLVSLIPLGLIIIHDYSRALVSMGAVGAVGALAPTGFESVGASTHGF